MTSCHAQQWEWRTLEVAIKSHLLWTRIYLYGHLQEAKLHNTEHGHKFNQRSIKVGDMLMYLNWK
jgi:hypothetical protein